MKTITKAWLHSSKDTMADIGGELEMSEEAINVFKYALYEVEFELLVDTETGQFDITKVNGFSLTPSPTQVDG